MKWKWLNNLFNKRKMEKEQLEEKNLLLEKEIFEIKQINRNLENTINELNFNVYNSNNKIKQLSEELKMANARLQANKYSDDEKLY